MNYKIYTSLILASCISLANAGPQKALKRGYILGDTGQKCWYNQEYKDNVVYFTERHTQNIGVMTFDSASCLKDSGLGLDANKMMINNIISRWYSNSDANFQTHPLDMHKPAKPQIKGHCIQSKTYSTQSIAVDYIIQKDSIAGVTHGSNALGCKK